MTKKMISSFLFGISFFLFAILIPHNAAAKTVIADTAHALSTDESDQIIEQCDTIYDHYNTSVYITITKKLGDQDDYIKYMDKIGNDKNAPKNLIFLLVGTKKDHAVVALRSYGSIQKKMTQKRCDRIASSIDRQIKKGRYVAALNDFTDTVHEYLGKSPALDRIYFKVFPQIFISILLAILILYRMLHFRVPKAESLLTIHLSKSNSRICGSLDHFAGTEQIRVTPQTLKQRFQKIIQAVGSFLAPLYDKIMVYLEPYLATYQKKRRDKKKEKEAARKQKKKNSAARNRTQNDDPAHCSSQNNVPNHGKQNAKANAVSKDLINAVARQNAKADTISKDLINEVARQNAKADTVSKDLINEVARQNAKK